MQKYHYRIWSASLLVASKRKALPTTWDPLQSLPWSPEAVTSPEGWENVELAENSLLKVALPLLMALGGAVVVTAHKLLAFFPLVLLSMPIGCGRRRSRTCPPVLEAINEKINSNWRSLDQTSSLGV